MPEFISALDFDSDELGIKGAAPDEATLINGRNEFKQNGGKRNGRNGAHNAAIHFNAKSNMCSGIGQSKSVSTSTRIKNGKKCK